MLPPIWGVMLSEAKNLSPAGDVPGQRERCRGRRCFALLSMTT
ncbi:MAG: hypothetical protein AVDCRST_MAG73-2108 [uncultured Thermomicrobiales bacterium]|uniref:Uncharacterized protein n=1 Tax=uncultured Thermomicrobiales bacterium TaxID=1645740 RepID=A0A6J4U7W2_9BACT|nr:MAG: hypothetical protein AVDCRST_MAG73-2108 [uncultured Thermomicrobiales bacterium]